MQTNRLLLLLVGLLHLSLAFPHGADHAENCTTDERVAFIIKSGTREGEFKPEVIPLNNTILEVQGEPRGTVVEEVRNGVKYYVIKTSVTVVISPSPTTSPDTSTPKITTSGEVISPSPTTSPDTSPDTSPPIITTTSVPEDPGKFITLPGFGSYKYHESKPFNEMMEICAKEDAVVAYPIYLEEVEAIVGTFNNSADYLAVGVTWNGTGMYNFEEDTPYFNQNLWDDGEPSIITGNCSALNLISERMKSISCSEELPFLCKKDDGFEPGYGYYTHQGAAHISMMESLCKKKDRTVAVPQSPEEAQVMATHALDTDLYLSVGLMRDDSREQYLRVGVLDEVKPNEFQFMYVNINSNLWQGGKFSGNGDCIVLNVTSEKLFGNRCDVNYPFICKKDLTGSESY